MAVVVEVAMAEVEVWKMWTCGGRGVKVPEGCEVNILRGYGF